MMVSMRPKNHCGTTVPGNGEVDQWKKRGQGIEDLDGEGQRAEREPFWTPLL